MSDRESAPPYSPLSDARNIPSLDGLRALSILLVVLAHSSWYLSPKIRDNLVFHLAIGNGSHGVAVFFVISGYLITSLLLRELDRTGTISLKRFYLRRSLRIFPPFYVLLVVMAILWSIRVIPEHWPSFVAAATYTWAYYPYAHGYFIQHSWSLSIEEQFYLLWPVSVLIWHRRQSLIKVSLWLMFAMPVIRVALYFVLPKLRGHEGYMIQGWVDTLMVGCLLALAKRQHGWQEWRGRFLNGWTAGGMALTAFFMSPLLVSILPRKAASAYSLAISPTLNALCIGGILVYVVENTDSVAAKILNIRAIRHLGIVSYSLYLWQQIFMSQHLSLLPYGFLYVWGAAELSYWVVERPSLKLRGRIEASH